MKILILCIFVIIVSCDKGSKTPEGLVKKFVEEATSTKLDMEFFEENFNDLIPLIKNLPKIYFENPVGKLIGVNTPFWHYRDKALILGDAAHATVPFYGQGMNSAFEDCHVFSKIIDDNQGSSWENIFNQYSINRKEDADTVLKLSMQNYKVMRNDVLDSKYLDRQKLSFLLNDEYPDQFIPIYTMVSFTSIPYAKALKRSEIQDHIINELLLDDNLNDVNDYNKDVAHKLINERLSVIE